MSELSRQSFRGARRAIEAVGHDAADRLERDELLRLAAIVQDFSELAPGLDRPFELVRVTIALVVGQFGAIQIRSQRGFYAFAFFGTAGLHHLLTTAAPLALAGGAPVITRNFQETAFGGSIVAGANVASSGTGFPIDTNAALSYDPLGGRTLWVPSGRTLVIANQTAAAASDFQFGVAEPTDL